MVKGVSNYVDTHCRVTWFAYLIGLSPNYLDGEPVPWVPWIPAAVFDVLANIFDAAAATGIGEFLANYAPDGCVLERSRVLHGMIGSSGVLDDKCKLQDPSTWRRTVLNRMMSNTAIQSLISAVGQLEEISAVPETGGSAPVRKGLNLDAVIFTILEHTGLAVQSHQLSLTDAFFKFDQGDAGLDEDEFERLCRWALGSQADGMDFRMYYSRIEELADAGFLGGVNDDNINDAETFPIVIMQRVEDCPLAYMENCRDYWNVDEDFDLPGFESTRDLGAAA
jgi:hypothetical protein